MQVIKLTDIERLQNKLENEEKQKLIEYLVNKLHSNFLNTIKTTKIVNKNVKSCISADLFKVEFKKLEFEQEEIMPEVQKKLEHLFPDCSVTYQIRGTYKHVDVTLSW